MKSVAVFTLEFIMTDMIAKVQPQDVKKKTPTQGCLIRCIDELRQEKGLIGLDELDKPLKLIRCSADPCGAPNGELREFSMLFARPTAEKKDESDDESSDEQDEEEEGEDKSSASNIMEHPLIRAFREVTVGHLLIDHAILVYKKREVELVLETDVASLESMVPKLEDIDLAQAADLSAVVTFHKGLNKLITKLKKRGRGGPSNDQN